MNFLFIILIILVAAIVPFAIGIYKDANKKMASLKQSMKEHEDYIREKEEYRITKQARETPKKSAHHVHA